MYLDYSRLSFSNETDDYYSMVCHESELGFESLMQSIYVKYPKFIKSPLYIVGSEFGASLAY